MVTPRGSGFYLGAVAGLGVTAVDAHPRRLHGCLAPTRVRRCWAFMGGALLHPSLPWPLPRQRGGKAKVTLVGWLCSPWSQAGASQRPTCVYHTISPQNSLPRPQAPLSPTTAVAGGHCGVAGDRLGVMSWVCTSCHVGTPWRDLPAPKVTMLAGTRSPTPASCAAPGVCSSGLVTALSPWGWHLSPCLCTRSPFPAWVLCVPGTTPNRPLCVPWLQRPVS